MLVLKYFSLTDLCTMAALDKTQLKAPERGLFEYIKVHAIRTIIGDTSKYLAASPGLTVGEDGTQVERHLLLTTFGRLTLVSPGKYEGTLTYTVSAEAASFLHLQPPGGGQRGLHSVHTVAGTEDRGGPDHFQSVHRGFFAGLERIVGIRPPQGNLFWLFRLAKSDLIYRRVGGSR